MDLRKLMKRPKTFFAFTLAELLIALAVLGVIATFTIPKILVNQQQQQYNAGAKEAMAMVSAAYQGYIKDNGYNPSAAAGNLVPYMNYVRQDTVTQLDGYPGSGPWQCSWTYCILLHNGARLYTNASWIQFGQTNSTNILYFLYDPDGKQTDGATASSANGSLYFYLYYNGKITTSKNSKPTDIFYAGGAPTAASQQSDPAWFSWN